MIEKLDNCNPCSPATIYNEDSYSVLELLKKNRDKINEVVDSVNHTMELMQGLEPRIAINEENITELTHITSVISDGISELDDKFTKDHADGRMTSQIVDGQTSCEIEGAPYMLEIITLPAPNSTHSAYIMLTVNGDLKTIPFSFYTRAGVNSVATIAFVTVGGHKMVVYGSRGQFDIDSQEYYNSGSAYVIPLVLKRNDVIDNVSINVEEEETFPTGVVRAYYAE